MRRCPRCRRDLDETEFTRDATKASGRKSHCRRCDTESSTSYYLRHRHRILGRRRTADEPIPPYAPYKARRRASTTA